MRSLWLSLLVAALASCAERAIQDYGPYPARGQARQQTVTKGPPATPAEGAGEAALDPPRGETGETALEAEPKLAAEPEPTAEPEPAAEPAAEPAVVVAVEPPSIGYQTVRRNGRRLHGRRHVSRPGYVSPVPDVPVGKLYVQVVGEGRLLD